MTTAVLLLCHLQRTGDDGFFICWAGSSLFEMTKDEQYCSVQRFLIFPASHLRDKTGQKQCWDAGTNNTLLDINSGQSEESNCLELNAECG